MNQSHLDSQRPLAVFHVPKCAGTSLRAAICFALEREPTLVGSDRSLFGRFEAFHTMSSPERQSVFLSVADMPSDARLIAGHFSLDTLRRAYPDAQLMTVFREPICRLISHWLFWRSAPTDHLNTLGAWADVVRGGQQSLEEFLKFEPAFPQTDNVMLRMLLFPERSLSPEEPIEESDDDLLLGYARPLLRCFDFVDILENPQLVSNLSRWLRVEVVMPSENVTSHIPAVWQGDLSKHLAGEAISLLLRRTRLDRQIWRPIAERLSVKAEVVIATALPRFAKILDPAQKHSCGLLEASEALIQSLKDEAG